MNNNSNLQSLFKNERDFNKFEKSIIEELLSKPFQGRDILLEQLNNAKVNGQCTCGCLSVTISVSQESRKFPFKARIPVEINVVQQEVPVMILLHVVEGYINELEILRADSEPLTENIDLSNKEIIIASELNEESNGV